MPATDPASVSKHPSAHLAATMLRSMRRIAQAIDVRSKEISRAVGLTIPQLIVLQAIRSLGEVTTQAVSKDASMSPATVAAVIDKLEAKGLVERYRSSTDRRVVHTRLTPGGLDSLTEAPALFSADFERAFRALPQADQAALAEALATIAGLMSARAPQVEDR